MGVAALGLALGVTALPAAADEAKAPIRARLLLDILAAPSATRASAYDESLKAPGVPPARSEGEVLPDGSVRYGAGPGSVVVTVKNPCPPGSGHYEPPALPGRRSRY